MKTMFAIVTLGSATLAGGCDQVRCAEGTYEQAGACRASLTPQCGPGTELRAGFCVPGSGGAVCGPGTHIEAGSCVPDLAAKGNTGRINGAVMTAPPLLASVGGTAVDEALRDGDDVVLVSVYEPIDHSFRLFGGSGIRHQDGSYALDKTRSFDVVATLPEDGTLVSIPFVLKFPVIGSGFMSLERTVLRVQVADVDGVQIAASGEIEGHITPANAEALYVELADMTFLALLESFGEVPDADLDGDGANESWTFRMLIETEAVFLF